jgi:hypothetical protein
VNHRKRAAQFGLGLSLSLAVPVFAWNDYVVAACSGTSADPEGSRAACHAYIEGFLDGALVTDTAIVQSVEEDDAVVSDFFERAYRTRVNRERRQLPATALAHFCIPEASDRAGVVETIATALIEGSDSPRAISDRLYDILQEKYPCPAD